MSDAHDIGASGPTLSRETRIWQRDELLLILKSTGRCLPLGDIAKFVDFLENVLPGDRIIKFSGLDQISRQLDQMIRSELIEKKGACYKVTERGAKLADDAELAIENNEETDRIWSAARNVLVRLPWSSLIWDPYLNEALKQIREESDVSK